MSVLTDVKSRIADLAQAGKTRYADGEERPLGGYLAAMGAYAAATGALAIVTRLTRREIPNGLPVRDVLLSAVATPQAGQADQQRPRDQPAPRAVHRLPGPGGAGRAEGGGTG
jgi:hypothetical protein